MLDEVNIEINRTTLKADLVYNGLYEGVPHIINMELQTGSDGTMARRLLQYHTLLHVKHEKPVLSVVLYPFEVDTPSPPYLEVSGNIIWLQFNYQVLELWKLDAQRFVQEQAICLYTLLPAMQGANAQLLTRALNAMDQHYHRKQLRHHLLRFHRLLQKSRTMAKEEKKRVEEILAMYYGHDWFVETNPDVIKLVDQGKIEAKAEGMAEGVVKGKTEGKTEGMRLLLINQLNIRFPALRKQIEHAINQLQTESALLDLSNEMLQAQNEQQALQRLQSHIPASDS